MRAGVPQLVMPYAFDQPDNALRMTRLGVGLTVSRKHYTAGRVVKQLGALAAPAFHERARDVGNEISAERGLPAACEAIETAIQSA
jgi:UDP:flavonoid glycosyltransferase YjiC (YdhE family)